MPSPSKYSGWFVIEKIYTIYVNNIFVVFALIQNLKLHPFRKYFRPLQNQYGGHLQLIQLDRWLEIEKKSDLKGPVIN